MLDQLRRGLSDLLPWTRGPDSWRYQSTADDILRGKDLSGQLCIVTGASQGIGLETAVALCKKGAYVIATSRNIGKGQAAIERQQLCEKERERLQITSLDTTSFESIEQFCRQVRNRGQAVQYIFMNAGICKVGKATHTQQGLELTMATNHFGHFKLFKDLCPFLEKKRRQCRIILTSSRAHEYGQLDLSDLHYHRNPERVVLGMRTYGDSKLANILMAKELSRRYGSKGITAYAVHPGVVPTAIFGSAVPEIFQFRFPNILAGLLYGKKEFKSAAQGAGQLVWAATHPELEYSKGAYVKNCSVSNTLVGQAEDGKLAIDLWQASEDIVDALEQGQQVTKW